MSHVAWPPGASSPPVGRVFAISEPPNLTVALGVLAAFTVVAAYAGYRFGTARMLAALGVAELPPARAPALYRRLDRLCREMAGRSIERHHLSRLRP
ncbi:MAG: hypothetical protein V5A39_09400 [Haloarculaceae archaeon]